MPKVLFITTDTAAISSVNSVQQLSGKKKTQIDCFTFLYELIVNSDKNVDPILYVEIVNLEELFLLA